MIIIELILFFVCLLGGILFVSISLGFFGAGPLTKKTCQACLMVADINADICPYCQREFPQMIAPDWQETFW